MTRGDGGKFRVSGRKPFFRLEQINDGEVTPLREIFESYDSPLYRTETDPDTGAKTRRDLVHLRNTTDGLEVRPLDSVNGVFVRITRPVSLAEGKRFRVGDYLIEARLPGTSAPASPGKVRGEPLLAKGLELRGELVFIRPDGASGLRFPLIRDVLIGRGGAEDPPVDIPLLDDNVSRRHAQVTADGRALKLHDLGSTNGTFLEAEGPTILGDGDCFRLGEIVLRLVRLN